MEMFSLKPNFNIFYSFKNQAVQPIANEEIIIQSDTTAFI